MVELNSSDTSLYPNVLDLQPKAHLLEGFAIFFLVLVWLSIFLRVYVRIFTIKAFGWDDGFLICASISFTAFSTYLILLAKYSFSSVAMEAYGEQNIVLIFSVMTRAMTFVLIYNALYTLTTILFKISLAIFFLRIVIAQWQRRAIYISTAIYTAYGLVFIFVITFRCGNPPDLLINFAQNKCITEDAVMPMVYTAGVLNAAADVVLAALPAIILWNSNMPRRAKISAGVLLGMGCLGTVVSIIRIGYLNGIQVNSGFFKHAVDTGLLSVVEPGLAIIASSLSALRPLFKSMVERSLPSYFQSGYGKSKNSSGVNSVKRTHRGTRCRASIEDQKGFRLFEDTASTRICTITTGAATELDDLSNDDASLTREGNQGLLVGQDGFNMSRSWAPKYSGNGVLMTRAVDVSGHAR